jgi:hypothetical protein
MLPHPPYQRITWRGKRFNRRTVDMIKWAEEKAGFKFVIGQGSYNTGVSASAGTHDGGGAADFSVRDLTITQRIKMVDPLSQTSGLPMSMLWPSKTRNWHGLPARRSPTILLAETD